MYVESEIEPIHLAIMVFMTCLFSGSRSVHFVAQ